MPPWLPSEDQRRDVGLLAELRRRMGRPDVPVLASIPALLVAVFLLVGRPDPALALSHADPTPTALLTAHFVHRSAAHLGDNLAAYALVAPSAYVLALLTDRRRAFFAAFLGIVVLLPPALSLLDLWAFDRGVTLGFSGVTMAFVGLVTLQVGVFLEERLGGPAEGDLAAALFFAALAFVAARTVASGWPRIALTGGALALAAVAARGSIGSLRPVRGSLARLRTDAGQLAVAGVFVVGLGLLSGFSGAGGAGPVVVNTFGHFAGYVLGFVGPYLAFRVPGRSTAEAASPPEAV